ncbi:PREDICTED: tumor protein p53-inducible nuclear protein 2 isoform X1 [Lepidothrix coronata]|uniref:Tumor protein p53-inducible nuclear protein 2 isoform X1 n=1 Tax=Lepidothrix coronata TaxID=321398 RepID=A0A6J0IWQ3_9PASS|nr:PREDICTED: tumor protein p53-inducible nuclear protein 2 isoform X1 [Lepidothrix coronata]XP_017691076.1 PREDICTED: tumor protein p53-inducible nuclear protein 2 isoform X1 [Lepidothrix coronata]
MFQRLTSLFFSDSNAPEGLEEPKPFVEEEEEEDGWLVIDLAGSRARPGPARRGGAGGTGRSARPRSTPPGPPPPPAASLAPAGPCLMDESWFVTPPPCFTAEEPGPDGVGSSPMEDLLIEHPSMSVYVTSTLEVDGEGLEDDAAGEVPEPRLERHVAHHGRSLAVKAAILDKVGQAQRVQRAKQLAERHRLGQKALQRQNRARQRPPRRAKQLPGAFVHQPCQRHCNY